MRTIAEWEALTGNEVLTLVGECGRLSSKDGAGFDPTIRLTQHPSTNNQLKPYPATLAARLSMQMALRARLKFGDVFEVPLAEGRVGFLQYIADDASMLDSYVIRVFEGSYDATNPPALADIVTGKVSFYAHVFMKNCVKFGFWKKIGNAPHPVEVKVLFKGCWDYGNPEIKVSRRWYVWRINEPLRDIGALTPAYREAEEGSVLPPQSIVERMLTGTYTLGLPD